MGLEHRNVFRVSYWDESGRESWICFPMVGSGITSDDLIETISGPLKRAWFSWSVGWEADRVLAQREVGEAISPGGTD